jgi:hypothetical protein
MADKTPARSSCCAGEPFLRAHSRAARHRQQQLTSVRSTPHRAAARVGWVARRAAARRSAGLIKRPPAGRDSATTRAGRAVIFQIVSTTPPELAAATRRLPRGRPPISRAAHELALAGGDDGRRSHSARPAG